MKKSVAVVILAISTLSIILVGLLFQKAEIYDPTVYVEEVVVTGVRVGDEPALKTYLNPTENIYYIENPELPGYQMPLTYVEGLQVEILYEVIPGNASTPTVSFYTSRDSKIATVNRNSGIVTFLDFGTETFTLIANDNSNASARIRIRAKFVG
ncbi:MAG TPA: hypothetical protein VFD05_01105 [Bacilli bacterium]|nr:hypothetical protein [Bacilli bacterium]